MPEISKRNYYTGWLIAVPALVAIVIAIFLMNFFDKALLDAKLERLREEEKEKLLVEAKLLQKSPFVEAHLGSFFYRLLNKKKNGAYESGNWKKGLNNLIANIHRTSEVSAVWGIFEFDLQSIQSKRYLTGKELDKGIISGKKPEFPVEVMKILCLKGLSVLSFRDIEPTQKSVLFQFLDAHIDDKVAKNRTAYLRSVMGCFKEIVIDNKLHYFAWFPILDRSSEQVTSKLNQIELGRYDSRKLQMLHLKGMAALIYSEEEFKQARKHLLLSAIKNTYSQRGCQVTFEKLMPEKSGKSFLVNEQKIKQSSPGRLTLTAVLNLGESYLATFSRDFADDVVLADNLKLLLFLLKICWTCFGIAFIGKYLLMKQPVNIAINVQLMIFLTWILFPAFYLAANATERYVLEKQTASMSYLRKGLEDLVVAFDDSIEVYKAWICQQIDESVRKSVAQNSVDLGKMNKSEAGKVLKNLQKDLLKNGVFSKNILLVDSSGNLFSQLYGADSKELKFFQNFFRAFYLPVIKDSDGSYDSKEEDKSKLFMDAQAEELIEIVRSFFEGPAISSMGIKPVSLDRIQGMGDQAFIYHWYIGEGTRAKAAIQVGLDMPSVERNCMLDWSANFADPKFEGLTWILSRKDFPSWFMRSPFWRAHVAGKMGLLVGVYDFLPVDLQFWNLMAVKSNEPFIINIDYEGRNCLFVSHPGKEMIDTNFAAIIPLDLHFKRHENFRFRLFLAMLAIFIICALIGFRIAAGFVEPLKTLAGHADLVTRGNFTVRLPEEWVDVELESLASEFNLTLSNLESGKKLKKFVSNEALAVIQQTRDFSLQRYAKSVDAVVLFLRIDKFWQKTEKMEPKKAIAELNRFFAFVCRQIRNAGGDVNKFIGEKIMATFRPGENETIEDVSIRAARCAILVKNQFEKDFNLEDDFSIRIGMAVGRVILGLVGSEKTRLEQALIGDSVNLASRLCTFESREAILVNRKLAEIIMSCKTDLLVEKMPDQKIKGKKEAVQIFSLRSGYTI
ncbi:MAG: hypothetical protein Kow0029_26960 [Candidatus Rifleibacteriota bacterium]